MEPEGGLLQRQSGRIATLVGVLFMVAVGLYFGAVDGLRARGGSVAEGFVPQVATVQEDYFLRGVWGACIYIGVTQGIEERALVQACSQLVVIAGQDDWYLIDMPVRWQEMIAPGMEGTTDG